LRRTAFLTKDFTVVSKSSPTPQPELPPPYPPTDILIDPDGSVRAGTVPALVELLTSHEQENDPTFFNSFLMTFKSFTTVDELFELLVQRFRIQPPPKMSKAEREDWLKWKHGIQSRFVPPHCPVTEFGAVFAEF
jgi:son of sevenless-like protein